ncbi:MAG: RHS repeat protein, partial [Planctomycetes bacterium]|nr:RHS repeat protein [Planctomycetota bacterium]
MKSLIYIFMAMSLLSILESNGYAIDYNQIGDLDLRADLNGDGYVGLVDMALLCQGWLADDCAVNFWCYSDIYPFYGDNSVDFFDYNLLANQWLLCIDPTNPSCLHKPLSFKEPPPLSTAFAYPVTDINGVQQLGGGPTGGDGDTLGLHHFSGEFIIEQHDMRIRGRGLDFIWGRVYRSRTGTNTEIGNNWDYSYNIKVERSGAHIILHSGNGRRDLYTHQPDGTWVCNGFFNVLAINPEGAFFLTFADNSTWNFLPLDDPWAPGKIKTIADRNGNSLTFDYDVTGRLVNIWDTLDRPINVMYNPDGYIQSIIDFTGRAVTYQYYDVPTADGSQGDLKTVTSPVVTATPHGNDFPLGKTTFYTYSTGFTDDRLNHNLLTITDPRGYVSLGNSYAATENPDEIEFDRVVRQAWGQTDDIIDLVYQEQIPSAANNFAVTLTTINDRMGNVSELRYDNLNRLVSKRDHTGRADPNLPTTFDPFSNPPINPVRPLEDPPYFETSYLYNDDSLPTRIDYPNGNFRLNIYEYDLDPTSPRRSRGNLIEVHHKAGALVPISDQADIVEYYEYDSEVPGLPGSNFITRFIDGISNETNYEYDDRGNRLLVIYGVIPLPDPDAAEEWQYNAFGQIIRHILPINQNGVRREDIYNYYGSGDPAQGYLKELIVDVNHLVRTTVNTYDVVGNLLTSTNPRGDTTTYIYNQLDQMIADISPTPFSLETVYFYDGNDNLVRMDQPSSIGSTSTHYTYDILNRRSSLIRDAGGPCETTTPYFYDDNSNLEEIIDPRGYSTFTEYDERDLVHTITRAYGAPTATTQTYSYDQNGNTYTLYDGNGNLEFENIYDGYNRLKASTNELGYLTIYNYDAAGNRTSLTDPMGNVSTYSYDPLNRLISQTDALGNISTYSYDPMGNRISETDANGYTYLYKHGTLQLLIAQTDPLGNITRYSYDPVENLIGETDSNGYVTTYEYDSLSRLISVTDSLGYVSAYSYDPAGNRISQSDANGNISTYSYDPLNRLITDTDAMGNTSTYSYDPVGNRISETDANGNTSTYSYDPLNRLITDTDAMGNTSTYSYDPVGNRISEIDANGNISSYSYDSLNRLITDTDAMGNTSTYSYDPVGNRISETDANGNTSTYSYDPL